MGFTLHVSPTMASRVGKVLIEDDAMPFWLHLKFQPMLSFPHPQPETESNPVTPGVLPRSWCLPVLQASHFPPYALGLKPYASHRGKVRAEFRCSCLHEAGCALQIRWLIFSVALPSGTRCPLRPPGLPAWTLLRRRLRGDCGPDSETCGQFSKKSTKGSLHPSPF